VAGNAIGAVGWHVAGKRRRAHRALRALACIRTIVAGVAAAGADRRMTRRAHRVGRKARCGIEVAIAALDSIHWDVRRRGVAGRGGAVVAA